MRNNSLAEIVKVFKKENNFLLSTHIHPDGDGIGAELALGLGLKKLRKNVIIVNSDPIPENYKFLPINGLIKNKIPLRTSNITGITIECSDLNRLGKIKKYFTNMKGIINIDHHPGNEFFGDYNYVESKASAVGESAYNILKKLKVKFNKDIATCIYTSILTDTGSFAYSNTTISTHKVVVDLLQYDVIPTEIFQNVYEVNSLGKTKLLGLALDSLQINTNKKVGWTILTLDNFSKVKANYEDAEGIINYTRSIKNIDVAISFTEMKKNRIKVSFRSKRDYIDVNKIAMCFDGGGHARAAGAIIKGNINEVKEKVLNKVFRMI